MWEELRGNGGFGVAFPARTGHCIRRSREGAYYGTQVVAVWEELEARDYGWAGLPRYALGVSSGGAMALVLAAEFPLQARCTNTSRARFFIHACGTQSMSLPSSC